MFALSNRSFRNAGLAFYGLGSLASLGMISDQASAQTLANNRDTSAGIARSDTCDHHFKDRTPAGIEKYVQCEMREIDRRIELARQRGLDADRRAAESQRESLRLQIVQGCIDYLKENRGKSFTQERMMQLANGRVSEDNACIVARSLGYIGRKAALEGPTTR